MSSAALCRSVVCVSHVHFAYFGRFPYLYGCYTHAHSDKTLAAADTWYAHYCMSIGYKNMYTTDPAQFCVTSYYAFHASQTLFFLIPFLTYLLARCTSISSERSITAANTLHAPHRMSVCYKNMYVNGQAQLCVSR